MELLQLHLGICLTSCFIVMPVLTRIWGNVTHWIYMTRKESFICKKQNLFSKDLPDGMVGICVLLFLLLFFLLQVLVHMSSMAIQLDESLHDSMSQSAL